MSDARSILLKGLDGSNPLAFLAALGTLRTLALALPHDRVTMRWELNEGAWRPCVDVPCSVKDLPDLLDQRLPKTRAEHPTRFVGDHDATADFYKSARLGTPIDAGLDAWFCALANDVHPNATSQLQTTRRDYFAGNIEQILANTNEPALRRALFEAWRYDDKLEGQSLHLDPGEDRRHAYQWNKPSGDPTRKRSGNMLGANRLALEAFPLFLGVPSVNPERLAVFGWSGVRSDDSRWTWPIWSHSAPLSVVCSLLSLPELQHERPDAFVLRGMGIGAAFRCRRILVEKTPNLTPSVAVV
jgi:CRISPR-associated endonuclease/helicase Cas3